MARWDDAGKTDCRNGRKLCECRALRTSGHSRLSTVSRCCRRESASQVGIKVFGNDLNKLEDVSRQIADVVRTVPGAADVYPEQISGAPYIDIKINRQAAARYGIDVGTIQDAIEKGIGETNLSVTIEGRRRFPIRVRYAPEFRHTPEAIGNIPIAAHRRNRSARQSRGHSAN